MRRSGCGTRRIVSSGAPANALPGGQSLAAGVGLGDDDPQPKSATAQAMRMRRVIGLVFAAPKCADAPEPAHRARRCVRLCTARMVDTAAPGLVRSVMANA